MISTVEYAEHRATLPGDAGFECTFYERLNARLFDLRERLYVTLEADGHDFRPGFLEHFPRGELVGYQLCDCGALGKGGTLDVLFRFYSPPGSGAAEEGASIVAEALEGLEERLGTSEWSRTMAAGIDSRRAARKLIRMGLSGNASMPYRPPPGALSRREQAPKPKPKPPPESGPSVVERWGALEDWDRMNAGGSGRRKNPTPEPLADPLPRDPGAEWLEQYRAFQEQQRAMQAEHERWTGGRC